jgi:hypothetical protein
MLVKHSSTKQKQKKFVVVKKTMETKGTGNARRFTSISIMGWRRLLSDQTTYCFKKLVNKKED